jgi:hypothetical protein
MDFKFKDWFFRQYPDWHQNNDVNKDTNGEGTWQRYLQVVGLELDEEFIPYMENFLDVVDPFKADDKYLPLIAGILGSPPSIGSNDLYRKVLANAIAIYKVKGTKTSYEIFFNLLGINISIYEILPKKKITYDQPGVIYDASPSLLKYDSFCDYCTDYWIGYSDAADTTDPWVQNVVSQDKLDQVNNIICFLQPIHAKFKGMLKTTKVNQAMDVIITETHNP